MLIAFPTEAVLAAASAASCALPLTTPFAKHLFLAVPSRVALPSISKHEVGSPSVSITITGFTGTSLELPKISVH